MTERLKGMRSKPKEDEAASLDLAEPQKRTDIQNGKGEEKGMWWRWVGAALKTTCNRRMICETDEGGRI